MMAEVLLRPPTCVEDAVDQLDGIRATKAQNETEKDEDFDTFLRRASKTEASSSPPTARSPPQPAASNNHDVDASRHHHAGSHEDGQDLSNTFITSGQIIPNQQRFVTPKDFELLKVIGMGSFGKVLQVRNKSTGEIHAMKIISKRLLRRKTGYVENILVEQAIMARVRHPFVVTMHCSFQTKEKLFLIMDFLAGGELFLRLGREGIFLEKTAAFYLAEIILALDHLHGLGVLHRDLKPENILLGADGHVCLTDFGLAKDFGHGLNDEAEEQRASTICGTQEYMAPEMIARKGYGRAADYWSLGCIAYEMLNGLPPFESKQGAKELFRKIMSEKVKMPVGSSAAACKLLKGLLNRDVQKRWGTTKNTMFEVGGVAFLKQAEFFKGIDWDRLEKKQIDPPVVLSVKDEGDLQHFHNEFTTMALPRSVVEMSRESYRPHRINSETFRGFSFIQSDYVIPDRDLSEIQKYWNSLEEDGQSVSECASSKVDIEEASPVAPASEVKKRPPRKRKKKGVDSTAATPAASAATTPLASAATSPLASAIATPVPSENGESPLEVALNELRIETMKFESQSESLQCEARLKDAETVIQSRLVANVDASPVPASPPMFQRVSESSKAVKVNQLPGRPTSVPPKNQQRVVENVRSRTARVVGQKISSSGHVASTKGPSSTPRVQGTQRTAYTSQQTQLKQSQETQDWRQNQVSGRGVNQRHSGPTTAAASHSSSDWRQHIMNPPSPRNVRRPVTVVEGDAPTWPSLQNDPPLTTTKATPPPSNTNLKGAWASRAKR